MLASRLVKKSLNKRGKTYDESSCVIPIAVIVLLAAVIIQLFNWIQEPQPIPLLPEIEGIVQVSEIQDVNTYSYTNVIEPLETFEAELRAIGVFTQENELLPVGTVALVYARNGWRFVEIDYKPGMNLDEQRAISNQYSIEDVILTDEAEGFFLNVWDFPGCLESEVEDFPGKCEITDVLYFELGSQVVSIAIDGDHATKGEVIEMARSILEHQHMLNKPVTENKIE